MLTALLHLTKRVTTVIGNKVVVGGAHILRHLPKEESNTTTTTIAL